MVIDNILIVSSQERSLPSFISLLRSEGCKNIGSVKDSSEAGRVCSESDHSLVIINTPLSDEFGDRLAVDLLKNSSAFVMVIVKSELEDQMKTKLLPYGAFVIGKPLNKAVLSHTLYCILAAQNRMKCVQKENVKLHKKVEDSRIINRAKYILMEYLSMSEQQAHRYIEKQAMDLRLTRLEVAKNLLSTYDG